MERYHRNAGSPAEILTMAKLLELGWTVSLPYGAKARYDLLADTGKTLYRIQVKTIFWTSRRGWTVDFRGPGNRKNERVRYGKEDCDYVVAMCPENGRYFVFPVEVTQGLRQASFRFGNDSRRRNRHSEWVTAFENAWPE